MKKNTLIILALMLATCLSAAAWQELKIEDGISITNITNIENYKKVTVKMLDSDGLLGDFKGKKIDHEIHSWGIKCDTKEKRFSYHEMFWSQFFRYY